MKQEKKQRRKRAREEARNSARKKAEENQEGNEQSQDSQHRGTWKTGGILGILEGFFHPQLDSGILS